MSAPAVLAVAFPAFLWFAFTDHAIHALWSWIGFRQQQRSGLLRDRPEEPGRSFRNFLIAQALATEGLALMLRSIAFYLVPDIGDAVRFLGFVAYGDLIIVAGFLLISWHTTPRG